MWWRGSKAMKDLRIGNRSDALYLLEWLLGGDNPEQVTGESRKIIEVVLNAIEREIV
jgi:hypothetical protein